MAGTNGANEPAARKVQRTSGSTFTVSLPKDWATERGLTAGSTVYLYLFENRVVAPGQCQRDDRRVEKLIRSVEPAMAYASS